jgi:methyl-accepting chemotaxis protein
VVETYDIANRYLAQKDQDKLSEIQAEFERVLTTVNSLIGRLQRRSRSRETKEALTKTQTALSEVKNIAFGENGMFALHRKALNAEQRQEKRLAALLSVADDCERTIRGISKKASEIMESAKDDSMQILASAKQWELLLIVGGFSLSIVLGLGLARNISQPVSSLAHMADRISQGDLSLTASEIKRTDEIGNLGDGFDTMVESLRVQTYQMTETSTLLASLATQSATTISQLSTSASTMSSNVTETSTTAQELRQSAEVSMEKAKNVAETARQTARVSESGKKSTEETIGGMRLVKEQMESIGETVVRLSQHSQSIEQIISTVQDIADQSNLLAVNASIEAARAGERGKGFAVVAHEIKSLADQSREATAQVRGILEEIRKWISAVVMATEQGAKAVTSGLDQAASAGESIKVLAENVMASAEASTVIEASARQQFFGADQVSTSMEEIRQAVIQTVDGLEQLQGAATQLEDVGRELKGLVARYKV